MVPCSHHVGEREERRHQRVVLADRQGDQCSVRLGDTNCFGLCSVDVARAEEPSVDARRVKSFVTEDAGAVGVRERHDEDIADVHRANVGADGLDDADRFVSHSAAGLAVLHRLVWPEIAAADGGMADGEDGVGWLDQSGIGHGLDTNVAGLVHDS